MTTTETLTAKGRKTAERAEAIEQLRKDIKEGATVYTILRHCSASGMSRDISLVMVKDGELRNITWYAAREDRDSGYVLNHRWL